MWGDFGGECSIFSVLPSLFLLAEAVKENTDERSIKEGFKKLVGIDFDDFMKLDMPARLSNCERINVNESKYMFYYIWQL